MTNESSLFSGSDISRQKHSELMLKKLLDSAGDFLEMASANIDYQKIVDRFPEIVRETEAIIGHYKKE